MLCPKCGAKLKELLTKSIQFATGRWFKCPKCDFVVNEDSDGQVSTGDPLLDEQ
jgi:transposase